MNRPTALLKALMTTSVRLKRSLHATQSKLHFLEWSPNAQLDKSIADKFMCLPTPETKAQVAYVWIDGTGLDLRSRSRTIDYIPSTYKDILNWSFDSRNSFFGGGKSDFYVVPIAMYSDPFRRGNNKIVMCETFTNDKKPTETNRRQCCIEVLNKVCDQEPMFGFEQDFFYVGPDGRPFGWLSGSVPIQTGKNYAGIGSQNVLGREISECIYRCCLYAGIDAFGMGPEKGYAQWELLTGPSLSIKAADDLWMTRYIIQRVAEEFGIAASFNGRVAKEALPSGLHTFMSTKKTREDGGLECIQNYIQKLEKNHKTDVKSFGCEEGGQQNDKFTFGVGDRTASIRIPAAVADRKKGFFEDRRPTGSADPYSVITALVKTCLL